MSKSYSVAWFTYGMLQLQPVQMKALGRLLDGREDAMLGFKYRLGYA